MSKHLEAAQARAAATRAPGDRPSQRRSAERDGLAGAAPVAQLGYLDTRAKGGDGSAAAVGGFASVTERGYEMWDMFGPYTEVVALDAFDSTLSAEPVVEFVVNHGAGGGLPMASTRNGTLALEAVKDGDETGLRFDADVDATRTDVADMLKAMSRGDLAEASFRFHIVRGQWSPDYSEYRILEVDLHRGDVSAVNFGANPHASSGLRSAEPVAAPVEITAQDTRQRVIARTIRGL